MTRFDTRLQLGRSTMIDLREYQKDLLEQVQTSLAPEKARVMLQLPTGGGKTVIAAHLLKDYLTGGRRAVWLTHRKELAGQTRKMLHESARLKVYNGTNSWAVDTPAPALTDGVVILMAQTASRRAVKRGIWNRYDARDLMIIDEAHHATASGYERAMKHWPGRILGMTATPWRLSIKEGFDHLFGELICGSQVAELQEIDFLCESQVLMPPPDERIRGGEIGSIGDYTESGIERANEDRPDIMTAGALKFWQEHARYRQTIIYAVSVGHARNLVDMFKEAGIPAGLMLGETHPDERATTIEEFRDGNLNVLVNVAVATEGFDLPDASCVVIARPTESLALYLQMVGRGLRPKCDGGDCVILDLVGNSMKHGLPEERREWSLMPRGAQSEGEPPVVWCEYCGTASPAASHNCRHCGAPFGEDCQRCGKWRAWKRWSLVVKQQVEDSLGVKQWSLKNKTECTHDLVCDLCHRDAHIQHYLPVTVQMELLAIQDDAESEVPDPDMEPPTIQGDAESDVPDSDNELDDKLSSSLRELLEEERQRTVAPNHDKQDELRTWIKTRESVLLDNDELERLFENYLATLPSEQRPQNNIEKWRNTFPNWERTLKAELVANRDELFRLAREPIDKGIVFDRAQARLLLILRREAEVAGLSPNDVVIDRSREPRGSAEMTKADANSHQDIRRRPQGELLPLDSYTGPMLVALLRMGGEGRTRDVIEYVGVSLTDQFKLGDLEWNRSGTETKWHNRVQWQYQNLKRDGYFDTNAPRGTWRLTVEGRELAERYERELP